ncbi:NAD(P)H-hydrate dehydratase [Sulfitobacter sp. PS-8MA]|uniref:NAD(P)H-hydrate dehydratase n=1 Tax=Sulfitobacter sp. PS-8MA TaxID=3237707 RepID=UPI0034C6216D
MDITEITRQTLDLRPLRKGPGHKYDHGHALVLSGGAGRSGAARMAARGALRIGAGAVTLGVPPAAQLEVAMQVTAVMLQRVPDGAALTEALKDRRISALCLGPGLGLGDRAYSMVAAALAAPRLVLDADAITILAKDDALRAKLHPGAVLTPHGGEFARLAPDLAEMAKDDRADAKAEAAERAAARLNCVLLLKGPETVIAAPDGRTLRHRATEDRATPWLATAGAGDVLSGFITGLLARGIAPPPEAAALATYLHAEAARAHGPGLIAEDLPELLPQVLRQLGI